LWWRLRISANLSAIFASVGSRSLISIPGDVLSEWLENGPRISAGASGFRSNVSRWLGPPLAQKRMTEKSLLSDGCDFSAASKPRQVRLQPGHQRAEAQTADFQPGAAVERPRAHKSGNVGRTLGKTHGQGRLNE